MFAVVSEQILGRSIGPSTTDAEPPIDGIKNIRADGVII